MRTLSVRLLALFALLLVAAPLRADDGYELWLRYRQIPDAARLAEYRAALTEIVVPGADASPSLAAAREELALGLRGLLGADVPAAAQADRAGALLVGTPKTPAIAALGLASALAGVGPEGYVIRHVRVGGRPALVVAGNTDVGALYGAFRLLRALQTETALAGLAVADAPKVKLRVLNHWDNLNRTIEHGFGGRSLWLWDSLPEITTSRYKDYARAEASIGINGAVLTNVNANAKFLTPEYLTKVAAIANVFRPYGVKVYLSARFSAPIEIGGLKSADPLDPEVRAWWKAKVDEIYKVIPDFGGFTVKANSEGQPGPQDYKRTHADGANMFAEALAPHGGVVMWRAFVYAPTAPDRVRQAYDEFKPLDGKFASNVLVQVKNGPLDFMPREPFSPLFGAMQHTPLMMEVQVMKEYLGQDTHLVYLGQEWQEVLRSDTYAKGKGSTVAKVVEGKIDPYQWTGMAGVSNIGDDRDWTGSQFNQANWYAFGRLAWDPEASASDIARDWIRQTFTNDPAAVKTIGHMMTVSREAVVNYMTPLGLVHIMNSPGHYGPGPWVGQNATRGRPEMFPYYYHRTDTTGTGFDRTASGSNALEQYFAPVRERYANRKTVPDSFLLFFHRVGWGEKMRSGRTLWDELVYKYNEGVDSVRSMQKQWDTVEGKVDAERFGKVKEYLGIQEKEAEWWRNASLSYFGSYARRPIPPQYEQPPHDLDYYKSLRCQTFGYGKWRCTGIP
jgi:alpha-glucuronidase